MLIINASQILTLAGAALPRRGPQMKEIEVLGPGHAVLIEGAKIEAVGKEKYLKRRARKEKIIDAQGGVVLPGFVDSHTHAAFAAPRLSDFALRSSGATYEEIAAKGGGILRSVKDLRAMPLKELAARVSFWADQALSYGTTTMEVKSGYGLSLSQEEKTLKAIQLARGKTAMELISTFLGAHALPPEFKGRAAAYAREVAQRMAPRMKALAGFCDVFCDRGYFSLQEAEEILSRAQKQGYKLKIHAEQLSHTGAASMAARMGALSADHLDHVSDADIRALSKSSTVCSLVPGSNFFLGKREYPPARRLIDGGCAVGLATDFNPGTCPTYSMPAILSIAVTQMKMTPEEAITAATLNGACALGLGGKVGTLESGKQADIAIAHCSDYREIPYYFALNPIQTVIKKGRLVYGH